MIDITRQTLTRVLLLLSLLWVFNCCAYTDKNSRQQPQAPAMVVEPALVEEIEIPVVVEPTPEIAPEPTLWVHVVRWQGETLSLIAQWYTGSWRNWAALGEANQELDPKRIRIGDEILIPEILLKTHDPMPFDFLPQSVNKRATLTGSPKQSPRNFHGIELFGPLETEQRPTEFGGLKLFGPQE